MIFFNIFTIQKYGGANFTFKKAKDQHMTIMTIILYMYITQGRGQIAPKILTVAKQFYHFNHSYMYVVSFSH